MFRVVSGFSALPIWVCAVWLFSEAPALSHTNLTSVNADQVQQFWQVMDARTNRITVLSFGDSMSESYDVSAQYFLFRRLRDLYGLGGITHYNVFNAALYVPGDGAFFTTPTANWWNNHFVLPGGGYVYWRNGSDPTDSVSSDSLGLFWIATPNGGDFTLSASANQGPWLPLATLNGFSPQNQGCYTNVAVPRDKYRLRVDGVSGTNVILGPRYLDGGATGGVDIAFLTKAGVSLDTIFSVPTNVLYPVVSAIDPHLIIFHMKESTTSLTNRLDDLETLWKVCAPNADVVYMGTPWQAADLSVNPPTVAQNELVRAAALQNAHAYIDCMNPLISYEWMVGQGYMRDTVHLSAAGNQHLADILWQELGFAALRINRELAVNRESNTLTLSWNTRSNVAFELQSSSNLLDWSGVASVEGDGEAHSWTNALDEDVGLFRLKVQGH